jgi:hypothetical protein
VLASSRARPARLIAAAFVADEIHFRRGGEIA